LNTGSSAITGTLASGNDIAWIEFYNNNAGSGDASNFYFGEMTHSRLSTESATINQTATITRVTVNESTDGLPNTWWNQYFGTTSGMSASADPDADGFTNAQEYALGTNPANANSAFRITNLTRSTNSVTISWSSVSGKSYKIQNSSSLNDNSWQDVADSQITATSNSSNQNVSSNSSATRNFYRVVLVE
ncbi:MAG: thrombospondin type 3 repeat-containing protein, partial [Verrucomicrobiota bacterium]